MPTDSALEKLTTLQVKRSQTAGVAETSTNMGNIFEKVQGLPLIISQQRSFNLLLEKVDNLVKIVQPPQVTDNEQLSVTGYESDSDVDEGVRSRSMSPGPGDVSDMNETRKMLLQMGGDFQKLENTGP